MLEGIKIIPGINLFYIFTVTPESEKLMAILTLPANTLTGDTTNAKTKDPKVMIESMNLASLISLSPSLPSQ